MFVAMNRFKVATGQEEAFEAIWRNRNSTLKDMPGFVQFHMLRGKTFAEDGYTLYASHTVWQTRDHFVAWTKSEQFRKAHQGAGDRKPLFQGHPTFEGFESVIGA